MKKNDNATTGETDLTQNDIKKLINTDHHDPFTVLGAHLISSAGKKAMAVRAFQPDAVTMNVVRSDGQEREYPMKKIKEEGIFETVISECTEIFPYKLKKKTSDGNTAVFFDSYSFLPTLSDYDLYLFNAGDNHRIYEKLGANATESGGVKGIRFALWAPNARSVSVVGDFNNWDARFHSMRVLGNSGVWEIFVPELNEGGLYKFRLKTKNGSIIEKTDPYAAEMELRPRTASKINFLKGYEWGDGEWIAGRKSSDHLGEPVSVYEVHLGSWARSPGENNRWLTYRELAEKLVGYVKELGYTHIELLPVMEHPFDASWGYQVSGYFAPTSRYGRPQDFMYFVDHCHRNGIGVILDWVPAHFPKDQYALGEFDGTHLYEHADPRKGEHQDWGTYIFNYGRKEVRNFLISNALFWFDKYHVDGLRLDAVASMLYLDYSRKEGEWLPNEYGGRENIEAINFLKDLTTLIRRYHPGSLTIAEESTACFGLKWNMGWMHDMLEYFSKDPIYRTHHHNNLTFALLYAFTERFMLPLSHDEVVHGKASLLHKMPGDDWQKFANLRLLFGLMYGFPGKKMLFMGNDFGQRDEWNHDKSLDWHLTQYAPHKGIQKWVSDLNGLYKRESALHQVDFYYTGFEWIDFQDKASSVISFLRKSNDGLQKIVVACNFTPIPRGNYRVGVPEEGKYKEILNSDSTYYAGGNIGNTGELIAEPVPAHNRLFSLNLTLPPLAAIFLKRE
jgi:1,4-alpha-glucan branching enzyme